MAGLYLFLKNQEILPDPAVKSVLDEIESALYDVLSIEEMENIGMLYRSRKDYLDSLLL